MRVTPAAGRRRADPVPALRGRVAVVTGAARGVGEALARRL
ncbi:short-chain dehydrogenase, partial [Streptomyces sp. SID10815]|nr:short-chain dehydrogenase [Streptomyces sp. SID10815]